MRLIFARIALFTKDFSVALLHYLDLPIHSFGLPFWPLAIIGPERFTKIGSSLLIVAGSEAVLLSFLYDRLADVFSPEDAYWIMVPFTFVSGIMERPGTKLVWKQKLNSNIILQ